MGKWCPDVVRLQGAVDMRKLGLTADEGSVRVSKFRRAPGLSRQELMVESMLRGAGEGNIVQDEISDPDVRAAFKAAVEAGLIPSDSMGGI